MMFKKFWPYLLLVVVAIVLVVSNFWCSSCRNPIKVSSPLPNSAISSPLMVTGEARGNWYFEASFPIVLLDQAGKVLAQVPAQAQGEWMTSNFVPFTATLTFTLPPSGQTGTLILKKDNPSGLPANDASIAIPVKFK